MLGMIIRSLTFSPELSSNHFLTHAEIVKRRNNSKLRNSCIKKIYEICTYDRRCLSKVLTVLLRREIAKDCISFGVMNAAINITRLFFIILIVIRIDSVMSWFLTEETSKENGVDNTFFIALRSDKFGISRPNSLTHLNRLLLAKCLLLSATTLTLLTRCHGHCVTKLARNIIVCVIKRVI